MVIMALDHVRDYFHKGAILYDPVNMETTYPLLFFTRFITHYCAPIFIFLAGTSAFLYGAKKTKKELSKFLFTRGLWLVFIEIVVINFAFTFDITFGFINLQVIWAIGICMMLLAVIIHLPKKAILVVGIIMVFGHNLLDGIAMEGSNFHAVIWYILHQSNAFNLGQTGIGVWYPIVPWVGVMALGYCFGELYKSGFDVKRRNKWLLGLGIGSLTIFLILRGFNIYGDPIPWSVQKNGTYTLMSFLNVFKYPPSLLFLLIALGPGFLFLYITENIQNKITDFFLVFGRVPFFYYVLHFYLIHLGAILGLMITGGNWRDMILDNTTFFTDKMASYGYSMLVVYLVWIALILALFPICKKYMEYKVNHKEKWWLSYL